MHLFQSRLKRLQDLECNLCLSNVLLASAARRYLLLLCDLVPDCLRAEVLEWEALDRIDGEDRARLDDGETARYC
jgi:hypothetical protein